MNIGDVLLYPLLSPGVGGYRYQIVSFTSHQPWLMRVIELSSGKETNLIIPEIKKALSNGKCEIEGKKSKYFQSLYHKLL